MKVIHLINSHMPLDSCNSHPLLPQHCIPSITSHVHSQHYMPLPLPALCSPGSRREREGQGGQAPLPIHTCTHTHTPHTHTTHTHHTHTPHTHKHTHTHTVHRSVTHRQTCNPASDCCIPTALLLTLLSVARELYIFGLHTGWTLNSLLAT